MKELKALIISHIKGTSGLTSPMISELVKSKYKVLGSRDQRSIHAILNTYLASPDEDEVRYALFLKNTLS